MTNKEERMLHCEGNDTHYLVWDVVDAWPMEPRGDYYITLADGHMCYCETLAKVKENFGRLWEWILPPSPAEDGAWVEL